ncbi:hypothetical protein Y590_22503 [Methylobacterium sp. AMS5]|nr:hypothetical protein Y590_22503 [Methylobacterium sp. AMS5]
MRGISAKTPSGAELKISTGSEQDFFPDEMLNIVIDCLDSASKGLIADCRRSHVLGEILANNQGSKELNNRREKIKAALRGYSSMTKATSDSLTEMGFDISEEGKHYKLTYNGDGRYTFSLSKSGSDHRSGLNLASDISKTVF